MEGASDKQAARRYAVGRRRVEEPAFLGHRRSIIINAPVEKVFEYIDDPLNDPEWIIGMMEVHEVEGLPGVGRHFHWTFKMVGIPLKGQSTTHRRTSYATSISIFVGRLTSSRG